jgi:hypothetical protein
VRSEGKWKIKVFCSADAVFLLRLVDRSLSEILTLGFKTLDSPL